MFSDWGPSALWRSTTLSHAGFVALGGKKSVLTLMPGWRLHRTRIDTMHCVNLGIAQLIIGNSLWSSPTLPNLPKRVRYAAPILVHTLVTVHVKHPLLFGLPPLHSHACLLACLLAGWLACMHACSQGMQPEAMVTWGCC
jgi:hypothetical protein